jgi:hypothetical protein
MTRTRQFLALLAGGIGTAAALFGAPTAVAAPDGGGGPNNPLLPGCEVESGGYAVGGESEDCAEAGNSQLTAIPNDLGVMGAFADEGGGFGMGGYGY